jgi:HSP20 family protein
MPLQFIKIIREVTDRGTVVIDKQQQYFCSRLESPDKPCWYPPTDIFETDDEVVIRLNLAGVDRADVSIKVRDGKIHVSGLRREQRPRKKTWFHQLEISYGPFEKIISVPSFLEHNDIKAQLKEGILDITISKRNEIIEIPLGDDPGQ